MLLTYDKIIEQIKFVKLGYFRLRGQNNAYSSEKQIIGDNFDEASPTFEAVLKSLGHYVNIFSEENPNYIFELELYKTKNSNQSGKLGPFLFVNKKASPEQPKTTVADQTPTLGLGAIQEQYQAALAMKESLQEPRFQLESERMKMIIEQNDLKRDKEQFEREKAEKLAELKELKEKFESRSETAKDGAEKAIWAVMKAITGKDEKGLAGATVEIEEPTEATAEEKMIESIAQEILTHSDNGDIDINDIKQLGIILKKSINKIIENKQD